MNRISAEILVEDRSGMVIASSLINQEFELFCQKAKEEKNDFKYHLSYRPHRGVGKIPQNWHKKITLEQSSLLDMLPAKCRAYSRALNSKKDILIVCFDADYHNPKELHEGVQGICSYFLKDFHCVIGIAQEELEAWLLGDKEAVKQAYPNYNQEILNQYIQDSVCGTWETLCNTIEGNKAQEIIESDYKITGRYKAEWAEKISQYLDCRRNISPSYKLFRQSLVEAIEYIISQK